MFQNPLIHVPNILHTNLQMDNPIQHIHIQFYYVVVVLYTTVHLPLHLHVCIAVSLCTILILYPTFWDQILVVPIFRQTQVWYWEIENFEIYQIYYLFRLSLRQAGQEHGKLRAIWKPWYFYLYNPVVLFCK